MIVLLVSSFFACHVQNRSNFIKKKNIRKYVCKTLCPNHMLAHEHNRGIIKILWKFVQKLITSFMPWTQSACLAQGVLQIFCSQGLLCVKCQVICNVYTTFELIIMILAQGVIGIVCSQGSIGLLCKSLKWVKQRA